MILRGLLLLARGKADGIKEFANTPEAVGASLAPLIAFPLVTAGLTAMAGQPVFALTAFLSRFCAVLALPLITYEFARWTKREAFWFRTVSATNWSFWPMLVLAVAVDTVLAFNSVPNGVSEVILALLGVYLLWLHWFILRAGLRLGIFQAALLVVLNDVVVVLLSAAPLLLGRMLHVTLA